MTDPYLAPGPRELMVRVKIASLNRKRSEEEWREALRSAVERHSLREVARFAGVSHARVAQIVGRKR